MKTIESSLVVKAPEGVTLTSKARVVTVKGPRGTLTRSFKHLNAEITIVKGNALKIGVWFGDRKHVACIRTVSTHINNMIKGVTKGFQYKLRGASAHFPINFNVDDKGQFVEVRNFLGEKLVRKIPMVPGVVATSEGDEKSRQIVLTGNSVDDVSRSAASINQSVLVKNKDIRKFLDGIYVVEKGVIKGKGE